MHAEFLILRFIHVVGAIVWVGGGAFVAFFLTPAVVANRQIAPQLLQGLQRRRVFVILPSVGLFTVLAGVRLLWIDSAGFAESYLHTGVGRAFSIGGTAAIIAWLVQVLVATPASVKLSAMAARMAASPSDSERESLGVEAERIRRRSSMGTLVAVWFGLLAASAMAIARYV